MNIRKHTAVAIFAALLATNSAPWIPMALANPVVPDQGKLGPKIEEARNGMTVVNINTPNDKGLSHNQYNAFNVDEKGLILNNANRPVNTELAGYIMGNPNLVGPTANTILNEVTGTSSTSMNGALEVMLSLPTLMVFLLIMAHLLMQVVLHSQRVIQLLIMVILQAIMFSKVLLQLVKKVLMPLKQHVQICLLRL